MNENEIICKIVGGYFITEHDARGLQDATTLGQELFLVAEPNNEHDPFAIAVYDSPYDENDVTCTAKKLGYLPEETSYGLNVDEWKCYVEAHREYSVVTGKYKGTGIMIKLVKFIT